MDYRAKIIRYISFVTLAFAFLAPFLAISRPHRPALLPDRGESFGCSTCHINPNGGGPRNPFGRDWEAIAIPQGDRYVPEIANRDSDGDGSANDEEFSAGTNPGDPNSRPAVFLTIMASAREHGIISPSGEIAVQQGASKEFAIIPDAGYRIEDVLVDGNSVLEDVINGKYTFSNVTADHTIEAVFTPIVKPAPGISVSPTEYDFGEVKVAGSSAPLVIVISNKGNADLNISGMILSDAENYFLDLDEGSETCESATPKIAAEDSCAIAVTFRPLSTGTITAEITISSDDPDVPSLLILLTGLGTGIKGDVNDDGVVRANDAILALRIASGLMMPSDYQKWATDLSDDGTVRANDAILILRAAAGLVTQ